jgi:hypothetical protein
MRADHCEFVATRVPSCSPDVHCSAEVGQARSGQALRGTDTHQDPERCRAGPAQHGVWSCSAMGQGGAGWGWMGQGGAG